MVFVASPIEIYTGTEAHTRLAQTNDSRFASERGILSVDEARWREAQVYERDTWLRYNLGALTDRNEEHDAGFAGYAVLLQDLGYYIELGCGPFTNSRFIVGGRTLASLTLLDPLIEDYEAEHPNCGYKGWRMGGHAVTPVAGTIEGWRPGGSFDTVVMTNVLSHCFDAVAVFDTVRRILAPGGYFVFHEDPRPFTPMDLYDVGHPLVVPQDVIDEFLGEFEAVYRSGNYFIGRKPEQEGHNPVHVAAESVPGAASINSVEWDAPGELVAGTTTTTTVTVRPKKGRRK